MNKPGRTPLMRAKNLEKYLGVEKIYLKLEGTNPFGHKFDRISEVIVKDALSHKSKGLLVDGSDDYINSIIHFCYKNDLSVKIPLFKTERWKENLFDNKFIIDFRRKKIDNKYQFVDKYCRENNFYNASNQYANRHLSMISLQKIGEEIAEKLGDNISTVFTQLSYGYTVSSLYNGFVNKWVEGDINKYPKIFSCTIPKGNAIFDDYKRNMKIGDLEEYDIKVNKYTRNLFTGEGVLLGDTLKAIHDTDGKIISIDEKILKESVQVLRKQENIILSTEEGYSFAGFYKLAKEGKIKDGKHVIVLNDGKSDLELYRVTNFDRYSKETIVQWIKEWLQNYSDPIQETEDAVESAVKSGFIIIALRNNVPQAVCVVVNLNFKDFIPTYHLGYIATKEGNKGRGIATELINQIIELTDGKLSLHVDLDNKRARKLYEKLGFKTAYYRMIYSAE
ncbi:pyridoxal-phosphate dependent enzyme [Alkaliphilus sp. MSJ-5]|uniref:Pyridoxal-phosphate dependent enzyme n=1 Tax=Alkaliphilus flagellatus TaxID=2841507 RepID=A0ABS6G1R2_9FIRM|nr:pyridoxal-phosphate dependent enzyme [Alkaliphilus flagellatus]MBU5676129.1 pyridoxal-phosphate dependent enzyme [Alkaliphilus flagellatus]